MRLIWLFLLLVALVLVPFLLWGDQFTDHFDLDKPVDWLDYSTTGLSPLKTNIGL